jgi:hypothetical protein
MACALLLWPGVAFAELDASSLLQKYDREGGDGRQVLSRYLDDMQYGASWVNAMLKNDKRTPLYCVPPTKVFNGEELVDIVRHEIDRNPSEGKFPVGMIMFIALRKVYPCGSGSQ